MQRILTIIIIFLITLMLIDYSDAQYNQRSVTQDSPNHGRYNPHLLHVSQVRRGMWGIGISVFEGVQREQFKVKIIGVIENEGPKSHLIIARFYGRVINKAGVIAGMSGSPVYINGKLIGAVSHAFPGALEPIGAIRPIHEMLEVLEKRNYKAPDVPIRFIPLESNLRSAIEKKDRHYFDYFPKPRQIAYTTESGRQITLQPIKTPILFTGISDQILNQLRPEMEQYGLYPIRNGSGGRIREPYGISKTLVPGDAVGISLITGDLTAAPVGTVTYRKGNQILIFGHPSFFKGPIDMPMNKQFVHTVVPTRTVSFKLASPLFDLGRVYEDRNAGVAGELGKFAATIPVEVEVKSDGKVHKYSFQIVKDNVFFPNLLTSAITQAVFNVNSQSQNNSIKAHFTIHIKNLETNQIDIIKTKDFITGNESKKNLLQSLLKITLPLQVVMFNPYVKTEILSIKADIEAIEGWRAVEVVDMKVLKSEISPGDVIPVMVTFKKYQGELVYKKMSIQVPKRIKRNIIILGIGSAKAEMSLDKALSVAKFVPKNYNHLLKILTREDSFNDLVLWLDLPERGLIINGHEHPNLPSSMMSIMDDYSNPKAKGIISRVKKVYRSNYLIYGIQVEPIILEMKQLDK